MQIKAKDCITITTWQVIETDKACSDMVTSAPLVGSLPQGHYSGIYGYRSQAEILPLANAEAQKNGGKIRIFSVFVPAQNPSVLLTPKNITTRTLMRLDAIPNAVQFEISSILGVSGDLQSVVARDPNLVKKIWTNAKYAHLTAISWIGDFRIGSRLCKVSMCTVRSISDISRIQRMHPAEEISPSALVLS